MGFEITLAKVHLHPIVYLWKTLQHVIVAVVLSIIFISLGALNVLPVLIVVLCIAITAGITALFYTINRSLWNKSRLYITNRRVFLELHRSPWNVFSTDLYFHNMRDTAYSYHSFLGKFFKYGTLFARNGSEHDGAQGLVVNKLSEPNIVRDYISYLTSIESDKRINALKYEDFYAQRRPGQVVTTDAEMQKKMLHLIINIKGITGAKYLTEEDKDNVWKLEEDRNIGVYEALMRKHVLVATHDSLLRPPAADIVVQRAGKIMFPGVAFPEIPQKDVVSCSPGLSAHQYLASKIAVKGDDATLLIGWN